MSPALFGTVAIEFYDAVFGKDRCNSLDPEFSRFLHNDVHTIAARYTLHEMNFQVGLGARLKAFANLNHDPVFADLYDRGVPLRPFAIEQRYRITDAPTQYFTEVAGAVAVKLDCGTVDQVAGNK